MQSEPTPLPSPSPNRVVERYDLTAANARHLHTLRTLPMTWAGVFGVLAIGTWIGVALSGDRTGVNLGIGFSAFAALGVVWLALAFGYPTDWPVGCAVGSREIRIEYQRSAVLVIPWTEPGGRLIVIDTPVMRGRRVVNDRPILLGRPERLLVAVPLSAMEALKTEMAAQGFHFTSLETKLAWRLRFGLPFGSTVLRIVRS